MEISRNILDYTAKREPRARAESFCNQHLTQREEVRPAERGPAFMRVSAAAARECVALEPWEPVAEQLVQPGLAEEQARLTSRCRLP